VIEAREAGRNIIWDQTSTSIGTRAKKFRMLPNYYAIAVVFSIPERQELERRLTSRPGKIVPIDVVDRMIGNWEEPTLEEGFMEIWKV
jgi:predicted kinase